MQPGLLIILLISGYLIGSIPAAYISGKMIKQIDLRQYGSGTVSSSMVWEHVGHWAVVPVALFDVFKAAVPVWLTLRFQLGYTAAILTGTTIVIGHNWPILLRFRGGRGISPMIGTLLVLYPPGILWIIAFLLLGRLYEPPVMALIGLTTIPLVSKLLNGPDYVFLITCIFVGITIAKRLEANQRILPESTKERFQVLFWRLIFDRDIANHSEWISRTPGNKEKNLF